MLKLQAKSNDSINTINSISHTVGLSVITTVTAIAVHHVWRKKNNSNAKISDYLTGTAEQWQRIEQANYQAWQTWLTTYYRNNNDDQKLKQAQNKSQSTSNVKTTSHFSIFMQENQLSAVHLNIVHWVSGVANKTNEHGDFDDFSVVGIDKNRNIIWQTNIPERVHDIVVQPKVFQPKVFKSQVFKSQVFKPKPLQPTDTSISGHVAVMGRRPSEYFWIMSTATGEILHTILAQDLHGNDNRHFYGHACYSLDGDLLYVTENDTATFGGVIGVYQVAKNYQKINEFKTHGIGPHEIIIHPDGDKLVIANGGIKTERASREELNIETMKPSLVYLSLTEGDDPQKSGRNQGKLLQQVEPNHNQMSVRHISAVAKGELKNTIVVSIQFQGERHLNMPLVLTHRFGDEAFVEYTPSCIQKPKGDWRQFHHYIASVMVNSQSDYEQNDKKHLICATSPIGGCVAVFDMTTQSMVDTVKIADCAGIAVANHNGEDGFLVSDGQGGLTLLTLVDGELVTDKVTLPMAFDNHMQRVFT